MLQLSGMRYVEGRILNDGVSRARVFFFYFW